MGVKGSRIPGKKQKNNNITETMAFPLSGHKRFFFFYWDELSEAAFLSAKNVFETSAVIEFDFFFFFFLKVGRR